MPNTLHDYARMGATARLTAIQEEIAALQATFPELGAPATVRRKPGRPARATAPAQPVAESAAPKRRKMSAKARKAISDAQKKRWAAQRKANG